MTINSKVAQLLRKVAAIFRVTEGDTFRTKAYINAAIAVENLNEPIDILWKEQKLGTIPGIGKNLQQYLDEYFRKGKVKHFESLFKKVPRGMFAFMSIRGVGPMTAYKIAKKFNLKDEDVSMELIRKIISDKKMLDIQGFKEKTVAKIKRSIKAKSSRKSDRLLISDALRVADNLIEYLKSSRYIIAAEPLGSLRRRLTTIGDIDVAISSAWPSKAMSFALAYPEISDVITTGNRLSHVKLKNGLEVDIKLAAPNEWGSLLQHYTGSKLHNIKLRTLAKERGLSLSEYGIEKKGKLHKFISEKEFYKFLGLSFIPPEIREGGDEIDLALSGKVPTLVKEGDLLGDLHLHSDFDYPSSHDRGIDRISAIIQEGVKNGYEYLGFTDHNPKFTGLSENQKAAIIDRYKEYLESQFRAYENDVKKGVIKLLIGMEVDIRPDGSLALSDKLLDKLDYSIVSIHSSFDQNLESNTRRIIKGLSHPKATILGHPTCQMVQGRDQILVDWEKVFNFCAKNNKLVEVNASPYRADLPSDLIKKAVACGVKLVIDTDAHSLQDFKCMKFGVWQARRGYAQKKHIANTFSYKDLISVLKLSRN